MRRQNHSLVGVGTMMPAQAREWKGCLVTERTDYCREIVPPCSLATGSEGVTVDDAAPPTRLLRFMSRPE